MEEKYRICQGCKKKKLKSELIKITKIKATSEIIIDPKSNEIGRSMYICHDKNCILNVIKKKRIKSALKINNQDKIDIIEQKLLDI